MIQEKVEELTKQKSQLNHHIFMVAAENRQLWNRLTRLTRANKTLGNQLTKISDTLKKHPTTEPTDILTYSFKQTCIDTPGDNKCLLSSDGNFFLLLLKYFFIFQYFHFFNELLFSAIKDRSNSTLWQLQIFGNIFPGAIKTNTISAVLKGL